MLQCSTAFRTIGMPRKKAAIDRCKAAYRQRRDQQSAVVVPDPPDAVPAADPAPRHHNGSLFARMGLLSEDVLQRLKKEDAKAAVLVTPKPSLKRKRVADEPSTSYGAGLF